MQNSPLAQASATHEYHSGDRSKRWLSYSQIASYLHCAYEWHCRYIIRLQKPTTPLAMSLGDGIHRGIASFLMGGTLSEVLIPWRDELLESIPSEMLIDDDGNNIAETRYNTAFEICNRIIESLRERGWQVAVLPNGVRAVELELSIPLPVGFESMFDGYAAHIDAIIKERDGSLWILDWKTRGTFQPDSSEETNLQNASYQKVCTANGIPIAGSITYQALNKSAAIPKLNKNGTMSRTKVATDWKTYKRALEQHGLNPSDYTDMMTSLATEFVRPIKAYRSPNEVDRIWNEIIIPAAQQIAWIKNSPDMIPLRSMSHFSCMNCGVKEFCLAALRGYDVEGIARNSFQFDEEALMKVVQRWYP